jgi:signal transduction histidine kinase/CheY-like chemotaxis protein
MQTSPQMTQMDADRVSDDAVVPQGNLKRVLWGISVATGVATVGLGVLVMIGWHAGNQTLVQVLPTFTPMQYNTALGFVCCGAALVLLAFHRQGWAAIAGSLAALIGGLTLIQYVGNVDLGIDELLMRHAITVGTSHPGRMAPNTAICFTLTGLWAVCCVGRGLGARRSLVMVVLASLAFGLGVVALSGYVIQLEAAYGWGELTRMAVHTSVGFIAVSMGLLCLVWCRDIRDENRLPRWMPAPIAIGILTATFCFWQAVAAEGMRIHDKYEELTSLPNLAVVVLIVGALLAFAMAMSAYLAQQAGRRAREVARAYVALQEEVKIRQEAEQALQAHRDNLEVLVAERTRELEQARREAEAANHAKSDFLSHMSHELRTPLNGILGYAQILQRDVRLNEAQRENLEAIVNCGDHLLALINDVLDLSKIEAGRLEVDKAPCNLNKLVKGVADIVQARAARKGIAFEVKASPRLPQAVVTDAAKLRQILVNLLGNAVKFTEKGAVTLHATEKPECTLRFDVEDTGVGIAPEEIDEIFDPFKQVEAGKAAGGTGLGLAITKRLVTALDGTLSVKSEKGRGSTFTVALPFQIAEPEDLAVLPEDGDLQGPQELLADGREWTILVADDRDTNRDVLQGMLDAVGFQTLVASDGDEALAVLREHPIVDLVLMDVRMPRVSGPDALKMIREDERLKSLKVIAVTASVFPEFRQKAIEAGFDDFLGKPFRVEELLQKLAKHLDVKFAPLAAAEPVPADRQVAADDYRGVAADQLERLRNALRIKNLTAIKAVAEQLSTDSGTAAVGEKINKLARAFDFKQLANLVEGLEQAHGSN